MASDQMTLQQRNDIQLSVSALVSSQALQVLASRLKWTWLEPPVGMKIVVIELSSSTFEYTDALGISWKIVAQKPDATATFETDGAVSVTFPEFTVESPKLGLRLNVSPIALKFQRRLKV